MAQRDARDTGAPHIHFIRRSVSLNDLILGAAAGVLVGTLPANAFITDVLVRIDQPFDAGSTNVLTVGTNATVDNLAGSGDVTEGSTQTQLIATGNGLAMPVDTDVFVKYVQTGTPAGNGQATVLVAYAPNR